MGPLTTPAAQDVPLKVQDANAVTQLRDVDDVVSVDKDLCRLKKSGPGLQMSFMPLSLRLVVLYTGRAVPRLQQHT